MMRRDKPKAFEVFRVDKNGVHIEEPEDFPAMYGGSIEKPDGSVVILDFVYLKNKRDFSEFVEELERTYENYYGSQKGFFRESIRKDQ